MACNKATRRSFNEPLIPRLWDAQPNVQSMSFASHVNIGGFGLGRGDNGAGTRIRTTDFLITNEALYQLSYTGNYSC